MTEEIERNKRDAIKIANDIWTVVSKKDFSALDARDRMRIVQDKVPEFCKAYPNVIRWMVMTLKYSEKAFVEYLNMLQRDSKTESTVPGEGYLNYLSKQAEYARILYKCTAVHWNAKQAATIYRNEYATMLKTYKDMQKEEADVKSEFEEEKQLHINQKIAELVRFAQLAKQSSDPEKVKRINEIVSKAVKLEEKPIYDVEPDGTIIEMAPDNPTPEELEMRETRRVAEVKAAAEAARIKRINRDKSFLK